MSKLKDLKNEPSHRALHHFQDALNQAGMLQYEGSFHWHTAAPGFRWFPNSANTRSQEPLLLTDTVPACLIWERKIQSGTLALNSCQALLSSMQCWSWSKNMGKDFLSNNPSFQPPQLQCAYLLPSIAGNQSIYSELTEHQTTNKLGETGGNTKVTLQRGLHTL